MGKFSSEIWLILLSYGVVGIGTGILLNSWWRHYYWASTFAAALSAAIFTFALILLDTHPRSESDRIMIAFFLYVLFIPLTFATGAIVNLFRRTISLGGKTGTF